MMSSAPKNPVLAQYERLKRWPFGEWLFARAVCARAPYFSSIRPRFLTLEAGRIVVQLQNRRSVQNHIGTIHAIALCNAAELAAGVGMEATLPKAWRWIPKGMTVSYLAKCQVSATATAVITLPDSVEGGYDCIVPVEITDADGTKVAHADINMYLTPKK